MALVTTILLSCFAYGDDSPRHTDWQKIVGLKYNLVAFVDNNSLEHNEMETGEYNSGNILIVFPEETEITIKDEKKFKAKSMVKSLVIDCKSGAIGQVEDMYFSMDKPGMNDKSVMTHEFDEPATPDDLMMLGKIHPFRLALCPLFA